MNSLFDSELKNFKRIAVLYLQFKRKITYP